MSEQSQWSDSQNKMSDPAGEVRRNPQNENVAKPEADNLGRERADADDRREGEHTEAVLHAAMLGMAAANPGGALGAAAVVDLTAAEKGREALERGEHVRTDPPPAPRAHRDPLTGAPGAHPVGVGIGAAAAGAASGAVTGIAVGAVTGPVGMAVGTAIGAAIGAVAGGLAGKEMAESVHPTSVDAYWREAYAKRPYVRAGETYEDYRAAYLFGWMQRQHLAGHAWQDAEPHLQSKWETETAESRRSWQDVREAVKDAWDQAKETRGGV